MTKRSLPVAAVVVSLLASACGGSLDFRASEAVDIRTPRELDEVELPVELSWEGRSSDEETYAVFLDRGPVPPGEGLRWLAAQEDDRACLARAECPDESWLRARGVYLVEGHSLTIDVVPERVSTLGDEHEFHEVTVVPFEDGSRAGERGSIREFVLLRGNE